MRSWTPRAFTIAAFLDTGGAIARAKPSRLTTDPIEAKGGEGRNALAFFPSSASITGAKAAPGDKTCHAHSRFQHPLIEPFLPCSGILCLEKHMHPTLMNRHCLAGLIARAGTEAV